VNTRKKVIKEDYRGRRTDRVKRGEEAEMLRLQAEGLTIREIAVKVHRKPETVKKHLNREGNKKAKIPIQLINKLEKLAKKLEQLTRVPEPNRPFLPSSSQSEIDIVEAALTGDTRPMLSTMMTGIQTPWWCSSGSVQIRPYLSYEEEALLNRFLKLDISQGLKTLLSEWEDKSNRYLTLKQSGISDNKLESYYKKAKEISDRLHSALWETMNGLYS